MVIPGRSRVRASLVTLLMVAGVAAGCSTSQTTTTTGASSPSTAAGTAAPAAVSKDDFVARANAICKVAKDVDDQLGKDLQEKYPNPKDLPEDQFQKILRDAVQQELPHYEQ